MQVQSIIQTKGFLCLAFIVDLMLSSHANAKPDLSNLDPQAIRVEALKIDFDTEKPDRRSFGKLRWLGGLSLTSTSPYFGGYSGLAISRSGKRLIAVSDAGSWLIADLDYDGRYLRQVTGARIGPLLNRNNKRFSKQTDSDAESIEILPTGNFGGTAFVAFERNHRIVRYDFAKFELGRHLGLVKVPKFSANVSRNKGFEALTIIQSGKRKGTIVLFAERDKDNNGNLRGWLIRKSKSKRITLKRLKGFDITGLAALPDGGLVVLERRFRMSEGVQMRIRRIRPEEIRPGALIEGETLLEARGNLNIDNMEGIATHQMKNGDTVLTLISDDNFSFIQRTLLMQFALPSAQERVAR